MPAPDPTGLSYYETSDGRPFVSAEIWPSTGLFAGNRRHRLARLKAVTLKVRFDNWTCPTCGEPVPLWRRADAVYCSTGCRKRAARYRRAGGACES
ncbi:MAG: hypothetical protein H6900_00695 [Rhodobacter sp.]|uniref:hypothetical protein n=1 Tax=Pararhodobacter sp. TaxID=2127056 RepID=UPI001DC6C336|nr:hypothetical protein [Pararhodobacter sp.]MCB1344455.1 hypothetical protein [Paracoccaceae bacterium]MCC0071783.1 hypothetical protein [Rhodobacter sp.]HPD91072.1 hypothetical protein [Pararhodobacter sp.]